MTTIKVWDPLIRLFHWSLVAAFAVAWLTADEWQTVHETVGYAIMALLLFRLVWGVIGSPYARFHHFVHPPAVTLDYLKDIRHGREKRYLGHNPAGGAMVVALLASLAALTLSGWLTAVTEARWLKEVHEFIGNGMLVLIVLHVAGVILASRRHRENLVHAMVTGKKRPPADDDIS